MYSDNAKTYIQLSGAALALTITFTDRILHLTATENIANGWMIAVWICFLLAVITGAFYQFLATKVLDAYLDWGHDKTWDWLQPGYVYGTMLILSTQDQFCSQGTRSCGCDIPNAREPQPPQ